MPNCSCPGCPKPRAEVPSQNCVPYGDCKCRSCQKKKKGEVISSCYKQPPRPLPYTPKQVYNQPTAPLDTNTVYNLSYLKTQPINCKCTPIRPTQNLVMSTEPMEAETVQMLSYRMNPVVVTHPIRPCNHKLLGQGPMQSVTTQRHDYVPKPVCVRKPLKPLRKVHCLEAPMDTETVNRMSYINPGLVKAPESFKPTRCYEKPSCPMDANTVQKMSYQPVSYQMPERPPWACKGLWNPPVGAMEDATVYKNSYLPPGEECEICDSCSCEQCRVNM